MRTRSEETPRLVVESVARGLGYTAMLIFGGAALVAAFSDYEAYPYWPALPHLRTDTSGFLAFVAALVSLAVSRYLELRRRGDRGDTPVKPVSRSAGVHAVQAVADAAAVCATGLVIYLSLNAITHPWSLPVQLSHLWPWPSEGTARVAGLVVCVVAVATRHFLRATATRPAGAAPARENPLPGTEHNYVPGTQHNHVPGTQHNHVPGTGRNQMAVPPGWTARQPTREP